MVNNVSLLFKCNMQGMMFEDTIVVKVKLAFWARAVIRFPVLGVLTAFLIIIYMPKLRFMIYEGLEG